ncbi:MAG: aromatic ring-hydroxylating dioxygenase subunit alpha [Albidovulum sp.]
MNEMPSSAMAVPVEWDRRGLPGWTYHSDALFELERSEVFLKQWQIVGHVSDIPAQGDWLAFDLLGERAVVMRGQDDVVRAFHNLCRHRGARVVDGVSGHCKNAMVCPFHGWVYNLDGTLRGAARPETFGGMDRENFGLKPIEMEVWHGFIFLRFLSGGTQPTVAEWLSAFDEDFTAFRASGVLPTEVPSWGATLPVNWKSVRDVDNEGYHVPLAHPALQDLYGRSYTDSFLPNGLNRADAIYGDRPGRRWSVKHYVNISPRLDWLPKRLQRAWNYYGMFANAVFVFTPETVQFYQEIPISAQETRVTGSIYRQPDETRQARAARYLGYRIDRETSAEDQQLTIWSNESMKSSAFDGFHLSDLEYGVRQHHDQLRKVLPVMDLAKAPAEAEMRSINEKLLRVASESGSN